MKNYLKILLSLSLVILLQSCSTTGTVKKPKSVHGDKPLIDTSEIVKQKIFNENFLEKLENFDSNQLEDKVKDKLKNKHKKLF